MRFSALALSFVLVLAPAALHAATEAEIQQFFKENAANYTPQKLQAFAGVGTVTEAEREKARAFVERYYAPTWQSTIKALTVMDVGGKTTEMPPQEITITREELLKDPLGVPEIAPGASVEFTKVEMLLVSTAPNLLRAQTLMEMITTTPQGKMRLRVAMPCTTHFAPTSPAQVVKDECESVTTLQMTAN